MALKHFWKLGSLLATLIVAHSAWGQVHVPGPTFSPKAVEDTESTRPFATPGIFDYDTQLFAPVEFTTGENNDPNTGFYASYDRVYSSFTRGGHITGTSTSAVPTGTDWVWGTRMEFGWMTESDDGWGVVYQHADGSYFTAGQDVVISNPMMVTTEASSVELNKLFRQSLKKGGYFEPYIGARYLNISDNTIEDTNQLLGLTVVGNRFKQNTTNSAFGLHAGARVNQNRGRWRTTADGAIATTYNQQRYFATDIARSATATAVTETYSSDQSFVPVLDLQYEVGYHISRDLALRTGLQFMWLWDGIARANTLTTTLNPNSAFTTTGTTGAGLFDDRFISAGVIFGLEWRR